MRTEKNLLCLGQLLFTAISIALLAGSANAAHLEEKFEVLQTRAGTYSNVTVTTHGKNSIFIMHSAGMATIFLADLSPEIQKQLGYGPGNGKKADSKSSVQMKKLAEVIHLPQLKQFGQSLEKQFQTKSGNFNSTAAIIILGSLFLVYFFVCYCLMRICKKTGNEPGILIWLPILQIIPMLRAANMSGVWFLAFFIPILNVIAQILWCFKIVSARGKGVGIAILLLFPITNLFAFLYLAFSDGGGEAVPKKEKSNGPAIVLQTA